jgi:hypothetical protein
VSQTAQVGTVTSSDNRSLSVAPEPHERTYRGGASYPIPVWSGLLEHRRHIGSAIWVYLWCLDKITKEHGGVGWVLGKSPVKIEVIAAEVGESIRQVRRHLHKLSGNRKNDHLDQPELVHMPKRRYLQLRRTPFGCVIGVLNSRKFRVWTSGKGVARNGHSVGQKRPLPRTEMADHSDKNGRNKEDAAVDAVEDAAAERAAASPNQEAWTAIGLDRPVGDRSFRKLWESAWATKNGHALSMVMGDVADLYEANGGTVPGPFFRRLAEIRGQEKAAAARAADVRTPRMPTVKDIRPKER